MNDHQKLVDMPLSEDQIKSVEDQVVREARRTLVGRRFINLFGPLGAGVESISFDTYNRDQVAEIDLEGKRDPDPIGAHTEEQYRRIPLIYKDFVLHWRDVKLSQDIGAPIDTGNAALASHFVAHREDDLIFNGHKKLEISGLLSVQGTNKVKGQSWKKFGAAFDDVSTAIGVLLENNHHPSYALTLSTDAYSSLIKAKSDSPVLELHQIRQLCTDGVFMTHVLPPKTAVLVSTGDPNFDIAVAEDLSLAYLGPSQMNYAFRVYESLVLRVKRPKAICVIQIG